MRMREWTYIALTNYADEIGEKGRAGHEVCKPLLELVNQWFEDPTDKDVEEKLEREAFRYVQIKRLGFE